MNDPMWDLADLSVEAGFGPGQDRAMMEAYHGAGLSTGLSPALYSRLELYKAMSDLHWSAWGFVQHAKGNPAEDFRSYGLERLGRSKTRMSGADFGRHLNVVRTDDSQLHLPYSGAQAI
jgi:thiamine kinase-like enzyme